MAVAALGCFLLLAGCAAPKRYAVDTALVSHWDEAVYKAEPYEFPYLIRYCDGKKRLSYLATRHGQELTIALVVTEFEALRPEAVVVEGHPAVLGFSPESTVKAYRQRPRSDVLRRNDEIEFAVWLAVRTGIPFIGGEPRGTAILEKMSERGYSRDDVLGYHILRQIPQWRMSRTARAKDFDRLLAELYKRGLEWQFGEKAPDLMSREEFIRWYEAKAGKSFDFDRITGSPPVVGPDSTFFNKLAADIDIVRNVSILDVVAECLDRYDRVLVVYGGGHYISQKGALDAMLGKPCGYRQGPSR